MHACITYINTYIHTYIHVYIHTAHQVHICIIHTYIHMATCHLAPCFFVYVRMATTDPRATPCAHMCVHFMPPPHGNTVCLYVCAPCADIGVHRVPICVCTLCHSHVATPCAYMCVHLQPPYITPNCETPATA